jgi:hypothetical protein
MIDAPPPRGWLHPFLYSNRQLITLVWAWLNIGLIALSLFSIIKL